MSEWIFPQWFLAGYLALKVVAALSMHGDTRPASVFKCGDTLVDVLLLWMALTWGGFWL